MQIRCPDCLQAIQINGNVALTAIRCDNCEAEIQLVDADEVAAEIRSVGHFELLHEVGRGAGGSVWKAHDTKLDRTVAVKLPRTGGLGSTQQNQLLREAQAVAQLNHSNIVSVYEVGRNDEGIYIVSDFVDGVTLEDLSKSRRMLPRETAQLFVTVCDALMHAHQLGVVHRDIKPSNIMLDAEEQPQVIDFGLAKRDSGDVTMTLEGKLLGTPAYMPPEQAKGDGFAVDCRADIYSLGVILYELLTGELPFRGTVRMLLQHVIHSAAPDPRTLNSSIPKDLATICLKCLEKEPVKRYQTCKDLAFDLQAWLDHKAIRARPIGEIGRLTRWCKRRPVVASLISLVVFVLLCGIGVSSYFGLSAVRETEHARVSEREAKAQTAQSLVATQHAEESLKVSEQSKLEALTNARIAAQQRAEAEANLLIAQQTVDEFLTQVGQSTLLNQPKLEPLRRQLLEKAMEFYSGFSQRSNAEPSVVVKTADAHLRLALILDMLGEFQKSVDESILAIEMLETLVDKYPNDMNYVVTLARHCSNVAIVLGKIDRLDETVAMCDRASALLIPWVDKYPDRYDAASLLAKVYNNTVVYNLHGAQNSDAVDNLRKAIAIHERLVVAQPQNMLFRNSLGLNYSSLGDVLEKMGEFEAALDQHRQAVRSFVKNYELAPEHDKFAYSLATGYGNCGSCLKLMKKYGEAVKFQQLAVDISSALVEDHPDVPKYKYQQAIGFGNLGTARTASGKHDLAVDAISRSIEVYSTLLKSSPSTTMYLVAISLQWQNLANVQRRKRDFANSIITAKKAIDIREKLHQKFIGIPSYATLLAESYYRFAGTLRDNREHEQAAIAVERAIVIRKALWEQMPESPEFGTALGKSYNQLGLTRRSLDEQEVAIEEYSKSIVIHRQVHELFPQWHDNTLALGGALINSANAKRDRGEEVTASLLYTNALDFLYQLIDAANDRFKSTAKLYARNGHMGRAAVAESKNQFADAIEDLEAAFQLDGSKYRHALTVRIIGAKLNSGDYRAAVQSCIAVSKNQDSPEFLLQSCVVCVNNALVKVSDDVGIKKEERQRLTNSYIQLAIVILSRLQSLQYYDNARNVTYLLSSPALATLRATKEFQVWASTIKRL
jgi:tetratricopeptide (TPR) repeat protein